MEQAFFIARAAAETKAPFTLRADWGHFATQRIQEMHVLASVTFRLSVRIACAGQFLAQSPQFVHFLSAFGTRLAPPAFL